MTTTSYASAQDFVAEQKIAQTIEHFVQSVDKQDVKAAGQDLHAKQRALKLII